MEKKLKKVQRGAAFGFVVLKILRILLIILALVAVIALVISALYDVNKLPLDNVENGFLTLDFSQFGITGLPKVGELIQDGVLKVELKDLKLVIVMLLSAARMEIADVRGELACGFQVTDGIVETRNASVHRHDRAVIWHGDVAHELRRRGRQRHEKVAVVDRAQHIALLRRRILEPQHPLDGVVLRVFFLLDHHLQARVHLHGPSARDGLLAVFERKRRLRHRSACDKRMRGNDRDNAA